mmetsp:Transcript_26803/g.55596  ORF Transcript_26803/g.55596 Transcript_26803/m.55596 type:complete len:218 (+) Transcript_26803:986-1639(+)
MIVRTPPGALSSCCRTITGLPSSSTSTILARMVSSVCLAEGSDSPTPDSNGFAASDGGDNGSCLPLPCVSTLASSLAASWVPLSLAVCFSSQCVRTSSWLAKDCEHVGQTCFTMRRTSASTPPSTTFARMYFAEGSDSPTPDSNGFAASDGGDNGSCLPLPCVSTLASSLAASWVPLSLAVCFSSQCVRTSSWLAKDCEHVGQTCFTMRRTSASTPP